MGSNGITIKKTNNDIYYSVAGDPVRYFDLESITIKYPELKEYIAVNRIMLERKIMQFRESYKAHYPCLSERERKTLYGRGNRKNELPIQFVEAVAAVHRRREH